LVGTAGCNCSRVVCRYSGKLPDTVVGECALKIFSSNYRWVRTVASTADGGYVRNILFAAGVYTHSEYVRRC